ncbi:hypothetical protein AFIC_001023 [[Pseudomonas] carboxydohydrogena]|uniref:Uncharacterized protein n=1 Tax=Afipia carboxydohydrogena TaxID=290 RepID=A0ABY8BW66_AFICR|nr:hypothetical protein [[Pseudomonas] carboxydohydrogena]WEF52532.1 hypothetical protein AFIC_001023 [[Pseudomonas] carboxydohydrogena]
MVDTRIHTTDAQRTKAAAVRRLLIRLENGDGEDRTLGADILDALDVPAQTLCPVSFMDGAAALAGFLGFQRMDICNAAAKALRERVLGGWKDGKSITAADLARAMTIILLKLQLAKLERAPA